MVFTRTLAVPNYNWEVEFYEPSVGEWTILSDSYNQRNWPEVNKALLPLIKRWSCTDRVSGALPLSIAGLEKLPLPVIKFICTKMDEVLAEEGKPKNPSGS